MKSLRGKEKIKLLFVGTGVPDGPKTMEKELFTDVCKQKDIYRFANKKTFAMRTLESETSPLLFKNFLRVFWRGVRGEPILQKWFSPHKANHSINTNLTVKSIALLYKFHYTTFLTFFQVEKGRKAQIYLPKFLTL